MHTNKQITFAALNSWYLDTSDMSVNTEYLNDAIIMWGEHTKRHYDAYTTSRRPIHSIVWDIFTDLINDHIKMNEYPHRQDYYASSTQLKSWLNEYGDGYNTLQPAIEYFTEMRNEYRNGGN